MDERIFFENGYALLIGVGADLAITAEDAVGMSELLSDGSRCAYQPEHIDLLIEDDATRERILDGLDNLVSDSKHNPEATIVIYFSGHGGFSPDYHFVPFGYDPNDLKNTAVMGSEFTEKLKEIQAEKLIVFLDCCHAGGMAEIKDSGFTKSPLPPDVIKLFEQQSGRILIASSRGDEVSWTGNPYSIFTQALREGFSGYGSSQNDGFSYIADIALYIGRVVPERTKDRQHPILDFSSADNFVVSYYAAGSKKHLPFKDEDDRPAFHLGSYDLNAYSELLKTYRMHLMTVEISMAKFIDQRNVPPDLIVTKAELLKKIADLERMIFE